MASSVEASAGLSGELQTGRIASEGQPQGLPFPTVDPMSRGIEDPRTPLEIIRGIKRLRGDVDWP